jgi:hypothetical protein
MTAITSPIAWLSSSASTAAGAARSLGYSSGAVGRGVGVRDRRCHVGQTVGGLVQQLVVEGRGVGAEEVLDGDVLDTDAALDGLPGQGLRPGRGLDRDRHQGVVDVGLVHRVELVGLVSVVVPVVTLPM